jgi:DNA-directed RNA polymerase subunit RPC12/RpoP
MDEENREPYWVGLWVECHNCGALFRLERESVAKVIRAESSLMQGSIGVRCPACAHRLVVRYSRRRHGVTDGPGTPIKSA